MRCDVCEIGERSLPDAECGDALKGAGVYFIFCFEYSTHLRG